MTQVNEAWDIDADLPEQAKEAAEKMLEPERELDKLTHRVFSTEEGKKWLDWYLTHTIYQPVCMQQLGLLQGAATGFHREGQNSIFHEILLRMKRATEEVK